MPEANALAVDGAKGYVYAACGDGRCHVWDLGACARDARPVHSLGAGGAGSGAGSGAGGAGAGGGGGYLHCCALAPLAQQFVAGGEGGAVTVWDCRSLAVVRALAPTAAMARDGLLRGGDARHAWVGGVAIDENANWLACGGGTESEFKATSGWLALHHAPSGALVSASKTSAHVQALDFMRPSGGQLVSAANEGHVTFWKRAEATLDARVPTVVPSVFAIATAPVPGASDDAVDAVCLAGNTPIVDVHTHPGGRAFQLTTLPADEPPAPRAS